MDILPSTRKRISSGCAGNGCRAIDFLTAFDRDRFVDFAFFVARVFFRECAEAALPDFALRLRGRIRRCLLRRPGVAAGEAKIVEDTTIKAAQNMSHQFDGAVGEEICAMNVTHARVEETRAVDIPDIICR